MEKKNQDIFLYPINCTILTDDSCCLDNEELSKLGISTITHSPTMSQLETILKTLLDRKEFVLFVGTAPSLSKINKAMKGAAKKLDEKDKRLNAKKRVIIINTSCFSGGLGLFLTHFVDFFNSKKHSLSDLKAFALFLSNHIAHFFVEPNTKRWNELIYVPRTGPVNFSGGKFRGNKGVYNHVVGNFRDFAYHQEQEVWICYANQKEEARALARQFKRCCPDVQIDISHKVQPSSVEDLSDNIVACFFLSKEVRDDEPAGEYTSEQYLEVEQKNHFAKYHITEISRFGQAYHKNLCPKF